jgi:hypothetical protein
MLEAVLRYFAYNLIKIHRTFRITPATAAGVIDQLGDVEDLVVSWKASERGWKDPPHETDS